MNIPEAIDVVYNVELKKYVMVKITYDLATKEARIVQELPLDDRKHMAAHKATKYMAEKFKGLK